MKTKGKIKLLSASETVALQACFSRLGEHLLNDIR